MSCGKRGMITFDVTRCLTDNLEISDDSILGLFIVKEANLGHILDVAVDTFNRLNDVSQVIRNP
jgi:hypothetical protein